MCPTDTGGSGTVGETAEGASGGGGNVVTKWQQYPGDTSYRKDHPMFAPPSCKWCGQPCEELDEDGYCCDTCHLMDKVNEDGDADR
jgi:hypothetical protein